MGKGVNRHKRDIPLSEQMVANLISTITKYSSFWKEHCCECIWLNMANTKLTSIQIHKNWICLQTQQKEWLLLNFSFDFISIFQKKCTSISYIIFKVTEMFQPGSLDAAAVVDQTLQNLWWNILEQTMNLWMISKQKYRDIYEFKQQNNWKRLNLKFMETKYHNKRFK